MEHALKVHVEADILPGPLRITAEGHLTADTCQSLLEILEPALTLQGCPNITIDLTEVTHLEHGGLQRLEQYGSQQQANGKLPKIHLIGVFASQVAPANTTQENLHGKLLGPAQGATVREMTSPIGPRVLPSQMLEHAAHEIAVWSEPVVVMDASGKPLGIITEADLDTAASNAAENWRTIPCGQLTESSELFLSADDPLESVLQNYQQGQIRPLVVLNGHEPVGVLHPTTVFQWCAEHYPAVLSTLSDRAVQIISIAAAPEQIKVLAKPQEEGVQ